MISENIKKELKELCVDMKRSQKVFDMKTQSANFEAAEAYMLASHELRRYQKELTSIIEKTSKKYK